MLELEYNEAETRRMPSSTRRGGTSQSMRLKARAFVESMGGPLAQRQHAGTLRTLPTHTRTRVYQRPAEPEYSTGDDQEIQPVLRQRRSAQPVVADKDQGIKRSPSQPLKKHQRLASGHPLLWVGLTLAVLIVCWWLTTSGLAWWTTTFSDPGRYGALHGTITMGVFGGGDSAAAPSKLIAMNNAGRVMLIEILANDYSKAKILAGPDLVALNFPDPAAAEIDIQARDVNHDGNLDVVVTIYADQFDAPFHRQQQTYTLLGDGKGGLKQVQAQAQQKQGGAYV